MYIFEKARTTLRLMLTIASAILLYISLFFSIEWLGFICLVPFLLSLYAATRKHAIINSIVFGCTLGIGLLFWMFESVGSYTDYSIPIVTLVFIISLLTFIINYFIIGIAIHWILKKSNINWAIKCLAVSLIWLAWEFLMIQFFSGTPWFHSNLYKIFLSGNHLLQLSVWGGGLFISWVCIFINILIAAIIIKQQTSLYILLISIFTLVILLINAAYHFYPLHKSDKNMDVAIINQNFSAAVEWNEQSGDSLVNQLLNLNQKAVASNPDLILWPESVVPWSFQKRDAFVTEILAASSSIKIPHILGMSSDYMTGYVYNSAYFITDTHHYERYDKRYLLTLAEKPLPLFSIPSFYEGGVAAEPGIDKTLFNTEKGKVGVVICNESLYSQAVVPIVTQGVEVLFIISNDAWFANSDFLLKQHWHSARLRAVENRINVVVNCNMGYSGSINMLGVDEIMWKSELPEMKLVNINMEKGNSFYNSYFKLIQYICFTLTMFSIFILTIYKKFK